MAAAAASRRLCVLLHRPPPPPPPAISRSFSSHPTARRHRPPTRAVALAAATAAAAATKVAKKKKKTSNGAANVPTNKSSDDYLKRRTRSGAAFDRDRYRRFADPSTGHVPVMLGEVLEVFRVSNIGSFVDCTLGAGGHSAAMIEAHREMQFYVGLDIDPIAHNRAKARIEALLAADAARSGLKVYTDIRNFQYIKSVLDGIDESLLDNGVDGILMDLGMSSMQVNHSERGFSVLADGPLDMRMDPEGSLMAEDILNSWPEDEVGRVLRDYGEEGNWYFLQKKIVRARTSGGLHSTAELVDLVRGTSTMSGGRQGWMKTATRVFQALRIAVNDELRILQDSLYACYDCLSSGGRLAVISFHSLEDRIVKQTFIDMVEGDEGDAQGESSVAKSEEKTAAEEETWSKQRIQGRNGSILTKRPITPSEDEEKLNRRCRSAKLRVIQKI